MGTAFTLASLFPLLIRALLPRICRSWQRANRRPDKTRVRRSRFTRWCCGTRGQRYCCCCKRSRRCCRCCSSLLNCVLCDEDAAEATLGSEPCLSCSDEQLVQQACEYVQRCQAASGQQDEVAGAGTDYIGGSRNSGLCDGDATKPTEARPCASSCVLLFPRLP